VCDTEDTNDVVLCLKLPYTENFTGAWKNLWPAIVSYVTDVGFGSYSESMSMYQ